MRGIGVEEATAVAAQELAGFLRSDRAAGDGLRRTFKRRASIEGPQGLRYPLRDEEECRQHADWEQDVEVPRVRSTQ